MLDPEYLSGLPEAVLRLWREAELEILKDMARRIASYDFFIPAAMYENGRLLAAGHTQEEILSVLSKTLKKSVPELRKMMVEAGTRCLQDDVEVYKAAGLTPPGIQESKALTEILNSGYQQTLGTMKNITRTTARTATRQFENALDLAWSQVSSGAFDADSAIRQAVKQLSEQGIEAVRYPKSGHVDTVETAVRRAIVTGVNQTAAHLQEELADELGCDLVEVSAHAGARPEHAEWQGKIYSRSGQSKKYPDFRSSTGYGTGAGLCGWNCKHTFGVYIEGSPRIWTDEKLAELSAPKYEYQGEKFTEYEAQQYQRNCERHIRKWKREYAALSAAGQDTAESSVKIRSWEEKLGDFLNKTGLHSNQAMEYQHSFGKRDAGKASKEAEEFYRNWSKAIGSENAIKTLAKYYDVKYNNSPRYELLQSYVHSVKTGMLSPMAHFDRYEEYYNRIQNELVGKQTTNGITISGQTKHFLERVFGTMVDPKTGKPRSGVSLDDVIQCVTTSTDIKGPITKENGKRSVVITEENLAVSVNPETGKLVQANPRGK